MTYPAFFRGGSPDIAIGREDAYRNYLTNSNQFNAQSRARAESESLQAFLSNQAREDQLRETDISRNFNADLSNRDFFGRQSEIAAQREENRPYREATVKSIEADTKARSENPLLKLGHSLAEKAAENGLILSPEAAAKTFGIPLVEAQMFHGRSKQVQEEIDQQDAAYQAAADALTRHDVAKRQLVFLNGLEKSPNPDAESFRASEKQRLAAITSALTERVKVLQKSKFVDDLKQDETTGVYSYTPPPRPWRTQSPQTSTGTTPPAFFVPPPTAPTSQPIVPPMTARASALTFFTGETANPLGMRGAQRFDFGGTDRSTLPSLVTPPIAQPPPVARTAYIPGRRYGNMRYLGGDPNNPASWQPVR